MFKDSLAEDKMALHFNICIPCNKLNTECSPGGHLKTNMGLNGPCKISESDVSEFSCLVCEIIFLLCRHKKISMIQNGSSEICVENRCNTFRQFRRLTDDVTQVEMSFHVEISVTHKCMEWLHHTTLAAYSHQTKVGAKAKKIKRQAKKKRSKNKPETSKKVFAFGTV